MESKSRQTAIAHFITACIDRQQDKFLDLKEKIINLKLEIVELKGHNKQQFEEITELSRILSAYNIRDKPSSPELSNQTTTRKRRNLDSQNEEAKCGSKRKSINIKNHLSNEDYWR